jgi:hypothetical protein
MSGHIRDCQVAESERRQPGRHPVRFAGHKDCQSVRTNLMLIGYGVRPCPPGSARGLFQILELGQSTELDQTEVGDRSLAELEPDQARETTDLDHVRVVAE